MFAKFVVPAFAVLGLAAAADSELCASKTVSIANAAEATALASSCSTVQGSVEVASTAEGTLNFDGLQQVKGDFNVTGAAKLIGIMAPQLNSIGGDFFLMGLTTMSTLSMDSLRSVGSIHWQTLNALQNLNFAAQVKQADSVVISDTQLNTLDGINLNTVGVLDINNNAYLKEFSTQITNVTGSFNMDSNAASLDLELPNLLFAYNMTLRNISTISIPSLKSINTTLGFYGDYIETIYAPNLTTIGGDLAIVANSKLSNVTMPLLKTVTHSFQIANNTELTDLTGFPALETTGAVDASGNFTEFSLPALKSVSGAFYAVSSGNFSCSEFDDDKKPPAVIQGKYTCQPTSNNVVTSDTTGAGTGSSTGGSSDTESAATNVYVNTGLLAMGALAGLVTLAL